MPPGHYNDRIVRIGLQLLFFSCFFLVLLSHINPAVIYSGSGFNIHNYVAAMHADNVSPDDSAVSYTDPWYRNLFILELTPQYLQETVLTPGGFTRFAVTLCIYACHNRVAGALVITALALFFNWIFVLYIQGTGARCPLVLRFVPVFFILTICAWYDLGLCVFLLPVAGALAFAALYQRLRPGAVFKRTLLLLSLFLIAWFLMKWGSLLLLVFIVIHELSNRDGRTLPAVISAAVCAAALYCVDTWCIPLGMTIRWSDFMVLSGLPLAVIVFFPVTAIIAGVCRFRRPLGKAAMVGGIIRIALIVCGITAALLWLYREPVNRDTRIIARTVHHIINGQWDAILLEKTGPFFEGFPEKSGALQVLMMHAVNHALCRTGQMGNRLLDFPQAMFSCDPLLMLQSTYVSGYANWIAVLELCMDLGMLNTAEKIAGELMERMGPYPCIIYSRALVQIAKGNREAAAVYLGRLAGMPFYRAEAKRLLGMLNNDRALFSDKRIASMSANRDTVDYFIFNNVNPDAILRYLLQSNPANRMAYDYLMTWYLLNNHLDDVSAIAPAASSFGYNVLPRCWEEALCLYQAVNAQKASSGDPFTGLRQETVKRFVDFSGVWLEMENDPKAEEKLAGEYGTSYYYYSIFKHTRGVFHE